MIKRDEICNPNSCLNRAEADEPLFVFRANDPLAPNIVRTWARAYFVSKGGPASMTDAQLAKYNEALALAADMDMWREAHT